VKTNLPVSLVIGSLCLAWWGCESAQEEARGAPSWDFRPNIVWLVAEDQSANIPSFGDSTIVTPTLSRLAAEGVRYTHVFSPSGVCAPSRAAIATGMYPNHIGAHHMRTGPWHSSDLTPQMIAAAAQYMPPGIIPYEAAPPPEVKMHSEVLREAGYYTTNNAKTDYQFRAPVTAWDESSPRAHWRNREPGQPFFAIFNFGVTHESQIWGKAEDSLWVDEDLDVPIPPYLPDTEVGRRDVRRMYSNIKEMDFQVGQILAELEEDGLLDSTIVFWYTDHGGPLPRQKRLLYDSGLRLPLIIRFPDEWRAGELDDRLISFVDFKPTILSLAGIEPPAYVDGQAFEGRYTHAVPRTYVHGAADRFDEAYDMIRAVRDHRFKYLRNFNPEVSYYLPLSYREQMPLMQELLRLRDAGELDNVQAQWFRPTKAEEELFDTENDPHELRNLATDPSYADKLAELRTELHRWMEEIDDKGLVPEPEFIESIWPGMVQPATSAPIGKMQNGQISLRSDTEGASIGYRFLDASETESPAGAIGSTGGAWQVYTEPIHMESRTRLVAIAHRLGYKPSEEVIVGGLTSAE
jgi:arylsulfatase A-like enzyme